MTIHIYYVETFTWEHRPLEQKLYLYAQMYIHHLEQSMGQSGRVANPDRGWLEQGKIAWNLARQVRPSRPQSACLFPTQAESGAYSRDSSRFPRRRPLIYTFNRHRVSPEHIRSRNCALMAFTAQSPPAQGQQIVLTVVPLTGSALSPWTNFCAFLVSHAHYYR